MRICDVALPKTANPEHIKTNSEVDFEISNGDMEILKNLKKIENYGESSGFPVYGGNIESNENVIIFHNII